MLQGKRIGLFITGGIASYKIAELARLLIKRGAQVRVVMTQSATEFITPMTFQILTKEYVLTDTFDEHDPSQVQHIAMADWCELAIVAPATANIISKMANGLADEIVSTTLLALHCPCLVVPAMNSNMYYHPATQRNLRQLQEDGHIVMEPDTGFLAEGYEGKGRLPELERILDEVDNIVAKQTLPQVLRGRRILVTAGGTRERIDPVRYISNDSSGKMGYALAKAAVWLGASEVNLISTTIALPTPLDVNVTYVDSACAMEQEVLRQFGNVDDVVMAAAVSDYRVLQPSEHKIKKDSNQLNLTLSLVENPDILAQLGATKTHQTVIGFAAETNNVLEYASRKLIKKQADWIVVNDVSQQGAGFNVDTNRVTLLSKDGDTHALPSMTKLNTAIAIWQHIHKGASQ